MQTYTQAYQQANAQNQQQELILSNLGLVRHALRRLRAKLPPGIDLENLEAAGVLGLVEAANRFDASRGIRFDTFAYYRIRGAVLDELRRNCPIPQEMLERIALVRDTYRELPPPVTVESLVEATGFTAEEVQDCLAAVRVTQVQSWDDLAQPGLGMTTGPQNRPDHSLESEEQAHVLSQAISKLQEQQRLVVSLYYLEDLRLREIGMLLDLSESRVSRLLKSALFNLGESMRARESA